EQLAHDRSAARPEGARLVHVGVAGARAGRALPRPARARGGARAAGPGGGAGVRLAERGGGQRARAARTARRPRDARRGRAAPAGARGDRREPGAGGAGAGRRGAHVQLPGRPGDEEERGPGRAAGGAAPAARGAVRAVAVVTGAGGEFAAHVRAALQALGAAGDGGLAARFPAPLVTAIVCDAAEGPWLVPALAELPAALEIAGVPRGRQFVLLGREAVYGGGEARGRAAAVRRELQLAAVAHEPADPVFTPGRLDDGTPLELDDELREAEAVICVGRGHAAAGRVHRGPYLLLPRVASLSP